MHIIPSTPTGLTRSAADARYPLLVDVSAVPGASKIPRAGVDGKIAAGFLPDLSGTYAPLVHTHDDRYYTEAEITALLAGYAALVHTHAAADIVSGTLDNARVNWGAPGAIGGTTPAAITGTALVGTTLSIAPDTDASTILGRARVDSRATDILYLSHYDLTTVANYALNQTSGGITTVNAASGQIVRLAIGGTTLVSLLSTSLSALPDTDASTILGRTRIDSRITDHAYFSHYDRTATTDFALLQNTTGDTSLNAASGRKLRLQLAGVSVANFFSTGLRVGDDTAATSTLHAVTADAVTNTITNVLTLGHNSSGTPTGGFGTGLLFQGESSTTENRDMGRIRTLWTTATDASRVSSMVLSVYNIGTETDVIGFSPTLIEFFNAAHRFDATSWFRIGGSGSLRIRNDGALKIETLAALDIWLTTNSVPRITITGAGLVAIGNPTTPTAMLDINSDTLRLRTAKTPASAAAAGNQGDICWDANYIYICTASNTWRRAAHATW